MPTQSLAGNPLPASRFVRLNAIGPVGLNDSACLHLHKSWVACTRCRDACPQSCLRLDDGAIRLEASQCNGCGRCAVACPTDALAVDGFALDEMNGRHAGRTLRLGCREALAADASTAPVPCLSGLSLRKLLTLLWLYSKIELVDSVKCPSCGTDKDAPSVAQRLVESAREVLLACGQPIERVGVVTEALLLPNGNVARQLTAQPSAGRRSFFSGVGRAVSQTVVRKASGASPLIDLEKLPKQPRNAIPYTGGHETRLLMLHISAHAGQVPVRACLPRVAVSDQCCAHGACSRLCPTGALRSSVLDGAQSLSFDAWRCVDCGACRDACPEKALHYEAPALRAFEHSPVLLSHVKLAECERCSERYSPADETGMCPVCRKSAGLSQAGFELFANFRHHVPAETGPP